MGEPKSGGGTTVPSARISFRTATSPSLRGLRTSKAVRSVLSP